MPPTDPEERRAYQRAYYKDRWKTDPEFRARRLQQQAAYVAKVKEERPDEYRAKRDKYRKRVK